MNYIDGITLGAPGGSVLVTPSSVVFVHKQPNGSELQLTTGVRIALDIPAEDAASALWGFTNETDNAFWNDDAVLAVTPNNGGSRIHFDGGGFFDSEVPATQLIIGLRHGQAMRQALRDREANSGS